MPNSHKIKKLLKLDSNVIKELVSFVKKATLADFEEFQQSLQKSDARVRKFYSPNVRLEAWGDFGKDRRIDVRSTLAKGIYWFATICASRIELIGIHERIRDAVEQNFMRGNVDSVHVLLDQHEAQLGKSIWSYQWRILTYSESEAEIQLSRYHKSVVKQSNGTLADPIVNLLSYISKKGTPPRILRRGLREYLKTLEYDGYSNLLRLILIDEISETPTQQDLLDLIFNLELLPLADRYTAFLRLSTHILTETDRWELEFTRGLKILSQGGRDAQMVIEKHHSGSVNSEIHEDAFASIECWDSYFYGDYNQVLDCVTKHQHGAPYDFNLLDLRVKSSLYLNQMNQERGTPEEWLSNTLSKILRDNDIGDRVYDELDRFALGSGFYSLSSQIKSFIHSYSGRGSSLELVNMANLRGYHFSPRRNESSPRIETWKKYLDLLIRVKPDSHSICFLHELISSNDLSAFESCGSFQGISLIRQRYFRGLIALKLGFLPTALNSITGFIEICNNDPIHGSVRFAIDQARVLQAEVYRLMDDAASAQSVIISLQIDGASALKRLNLTQYYKLSYSKRRSLSSSIDLPILAWLAKVDPHQICLTIKRFLKHWGAILPSNLLDFDLPFDDLRIREFIFRVCAAENLDSISNLDTNDKVERERLKLLNWVSTNYEYLASQVEKEKLNLIQVSQLRDGLDRIDDNKLVLDLASLQEVESQNLEEIHQDYVSRLELAIATFTEKIEKVVREVSAEGGRKTIVVTQDDLMRSMDDAFLTAFDRLRRVFIRSPQFGFEGCLSGRIRHGIVVEHLLKPLKAHSLLISDRTREQVSGRNFVDLGYLNMATEEQRGAAIIVLVTLTNNVATEARKFRDEVIQTSLNAEDTKPAFNYYFSSSDLLKNREIVPSEITDWKPFSFEIFSILAERTRISLPPLRSYIANELRASLMSFFDSSVKEVETIGGLQELRSRILKAKQDMDDACGHMLRWFQDLTGAIGQDVDLDFAVNTAVGMLERLHPEFQRLYQKDVGCGLRLKGQFFTSFVHVIFFLVENGVKHTNIDSTSFVGRVSLHPENDKIRLQVYSSMATFEASDKAAATINARIKGIEVDFNPDSVIREKGSGFAKIIATLRYEFKATGYTLRAFTENQFVVVEILTTSIVATE